MTSSKILLFSHSALPVVMGFWHLSVHTHLLIRHLAHCLICANSKRSYVNQNGQYIFFEV